MPGGFLKKLATASCAITATSVAVARVWPAGDSAVDRITVATTRAARTVPTGRVIGSLRAGKSIRKHWRVLDCRAWSTSGDSHVTVATEAAEREEKQPIGLAISSGSAFS